MDDASIMDLVVGKIEARIGGRSGTKMLREVRRVVAPFVGHNGWISAGQLKKALEYWVVGVDLDGFCDRFVAKQHNKLSVARLGAELIAHSSGEAVRPSTAESSSSVASSRSALASALVRDQIPGASDIPQRAVGMLVKRCRAVSDGHRHLALPQWKVALRAVAPQLRDRDLEDLWRACDGDYARFAADLFREDETTEEQPPPPPPVQEVSVEEPREEEMPRPKVEQAWAAAPKDETQDLTLARVHGFGGGKLLGVDAGALVYATGSVVVAGEKFFYLEHAKEVTALCVRDGLCCSADADGIRVWRTDSARHHVAWLGRGLFAAVTAVALARDFVLAVGERAEARTTVGVALFGVTTGDLLGEEVATSTGRRIATAQAAADDDDCFFVTAGDGHVCFWQLTTTIAPVLLATPGRFGAKVPKPRALLDAAFAPRDASTEGPRVAFLAGDDGRVYVFRDATCHASFAAHDGPINALCCSRGGGDDAALRLVSGGHDAKLKLWTGTNLALSAECALPASPRGTVVAAVVCRGDAWCVATARGSILDCDLLGSTKKRGRAVGVVRGRIAGGHRAPVRAVAAHPADPRKFATTGDDRRLVTWSLDADNDGILQTARLDTPGTALAYDHAPPDAFGGGGVVVVDALVVGCASGDVVRCDPTTLAVAKTAKLSKHAITALRPVPSKGGLLVVATASGEVLVTARRAPRALRSLRGHLARVRSLDLADEAVLRSQDDAGHTFFWLLDGANSRRLDKPRVDAWHAEPDVVAVTKANNSRQLFAIATATGLHLGTRPREGESRGNWGHVRGISALAFLADDKHLVTLGVDDRALFVWAVREYDDDLSDDNNDAASVLDQAFLQQRDDGDDESCATPHSLTTATPTSSNLHHAQPPAWATARPSSVASSDYAWPF